MSQYDLDDPKYRKVLDHGFVYLVDHMGDDSSLIQAARVSYGKGTKSVREDRGLIRYLFKHQHCYHPDMEVLTINGWKRWDECEKVETFLVPDPVTRTYKEETLDVKSFDVQDITLYTFENERMSYKVTSDHTMWFKGKYQKEFSKVPVQEMPKSGGFFESLIYYSNSLKIFDQSSKHTILENAEQYHGTENFTGKVYCATTSTGLLAVRGSSNTYGFVCGNSTPIEMCELKFHLKIPIFVMRQIIRHRTACLSGDSLLYFDTSENSKMITIKEIYNSWHDKNSQFKNIRMCNEETGKIEHTNITNIWESGIKPVYEVELENGYKLKMSKDHRCLTEDGWMTLHDAVGLSLNDNSWNINSPAFSINETFNETLLSFRTFSKVKNIRLVGEEMTYDLSVSGPFHNFVANGFIVHNSVNEYSARYSEMTDEFYIPNFDVIQPQSKDNKQGRSGEVSDKTKTGVQWLFKTMYDTAYDAYQTLLGSKTSDKFIGDGPVYDAYDKDDPLFDDEFNGIARELSRAVLPVGNYTECYWKIDLKNLFNFLKLRMDLHAQYEVRVFANAMYELIQPLFPMSCEAANDYMFEAYNLSRMEINMLKDLLSIAKVSTTFVKDGKDKEMAEKYGLSLREFREFKERFEI